MEAYTLTHTHIQTYTHKHTHTHVYTYTYIQTSTHKHTDTHAYLAPTVRVNFEELSNELLMFFYFFDRFLCVTFLLLTVLVNYGNLGNELLLLDYGFLIDPNPHDRCALSFDMALVTLGFSFFFPQPAQQMYPLV